MDLQTLANLGEFFGGMFVVVSLAYLAYQVRQNTRSLRSENYARLLEGMSTLQSRLAMDAELNHLILVGAQDPSRLSRSDRVRFSWALYELFGTAEFMYHQWQEGTLPPVVWRRWEATIGWWLSHPGMRAWWVAKPTPLASDFQRLGDEMIRCDRFDAEAVGRWHGFVAGGGPTAPSTRASPPGSRSTSAMNGNSGSTIP